MRWCAGDELELRRPTHAGRGSKWGSIRVANLITLLLIQNQCVQFGQIGRFFYQVFKPFIVSAVPIFVGRYVSLQVTWIKDTWQRSVFAESYRLFKERDQSENQMSSV